jgi:hypothetical protein
VCLGGGFIQNSRKFPDFLSSGFIIGLLGFQPAIPDHTNLSRRFQDLVILRNFSSSRFKTIISNKLKL